MLRSLEATGRRCRGEARGDARGVPEFLCGGVAIKWVEVKGGGGCGRGKGTRGRGEGGDDDGFCHLDDDRGFSHLDDARAVELRMWH